jgi:cation/acetate symporter
LFPYTQPALFAMPIAFILTYIFSKSDTGPRSKLEKEAFEDQYVRAQTGFGASGASH